MNATLEQLDDLFGLVNDAVNATQRDPLDLRRYTQKQSEFLASTAIVTLYRTGNQAGKTFALIDDAIYTALGRHPFRRTPPPPVSLMFVSVSDDQMRQPNGLMAKIRSALPEEAIDWDQTAYDPARGFAGRPARIVFKNGSIIGFGTFKQDAQRFAGATLHAVYMDEPPPERKFAELRARVWNRRGFMRISFTPTPDAPPLGYLRRLVDAGDVAEVHCVTTEANVWAEGALAPMYTQAEIDEFINSYPEYEREMRRSGAWDPIVVDRMLSAFAPHHVVDFDLAELRGAYLEIGIDHGALAGKQRAVLTAWVARDTPRPRGWVVAEVGLEGVATTPEDDAAAILRMLDELGLSYDDVDEWVGDRSLETKASYATKSNDALLEELARLLHREPDDPRMRPIFTARKKNGSVNLGIRKMNALFGRVDRDRRGVIVPHVKVHPRCVGTIKAFQEWAGDRKDPVKDAFDAARYAFERAVTDAVIDTVISRRA